MLWTPWSPSIPSSTSPGTKAPLLRLIHVWLAPGGSFLCTLGAHDAQADIEGDWLGAPMYWSSFDVDATLRMLRAAGFAILCSRLETAEEDGQPVTFLWVLARRERCPPWRSPCHGPFSLRYAAFRRPRPETPEHRCQESVRGRGQGGHAAHPRRGAGGTARRRGSCSVATAARMLRRCGMRSRSRVSTWRPGCRGCRGTGASTTHGHTGRVPTHVGCCARTWRTGSSPGRTGDSWAGRGCTTSTEACARSRSATGSGARPTDGQESNAAAAPCPWSVPWRCAANNHSPSADHSRSGRRLPAPGRGPTRPAA